MTDIKNLKPTEIYVYPKTFNEAVECFALFEKMGFEKDIYEPCSNASFFICENRISYWHEKLPELTEITLYELRQMAGVEESKPDEVPALRKENELLRECLKGAVQIMQQTKKHRENVGWIGGDIFLNATISEAENLLNP